MIFKILKGYSYGNIGKALDYHEKKVRRGVANKDYVMSSIPMTSGESIADTLSAHMRINNPKKRGSHFHHISANFPKEDNLSLEVKRQIVLDYLKGMGYEDTLRCAYRHSDKAHDHWHVFTTGSDINGQLINTRDDHNRSVKVSRALERAYGLRTLRSSVNEKSETLDVDNYRYARGLVNYIKLCELQGIEMDDACSLAFLQNGERMTNDELKELYRREEATEDFKKLIRILSKANVLDPSRKSRLLERARVIKKESTDMVQFIENFNDESQGFYARYLANKHEITFGFQNLYMEGPKLSKEFSALELKKYWDQTSKSVGQGRGQVPDHDEVTFAQVKKFVKSRVHRLIYYSDSFEDLAERLKKDDIIVDLVIRKDGNSSLTFTHMGFKIKSSAMQLGYESIKEKITTLNKSQQKFLKDLLRKQQTIKKSVGGKKMINSTLYSLSGNTTQTAREEENKQKHKYNPDL